MDITAFNEPAVTVCPRVFTVSLPSDMSDMFTTLSSHTSGVTGGGGVREDLNYD
jgi:hypothetical protein